MVRRLGVLVVALAFVTSAACGKSSGKAGTVSGDAPTTSVSPRAVVTEAKTLDNASLQSILPKVAELPSGYATSTDSSSSESTDDFCEGHNPVSEVPSTGKATASFSKGTFGPFLVFSAASYGKGGAAKFMDAVRHGAEACKSYTQTENDGSKTNVTLSPLSFSKMGDETFAIRGAFTSASGSSGGVTATADVAYVRTGDIVVEAAALGFLAPPDSSDMSRLARVVADRANKLQ